MRVRERTNEKGSKNNNVGWRGLGSSGPRLTIEQKKMLSRYVNIIIFRVGALIYLFIYWIGALID